MEALVKLVILGQSLRKLYSSQAGDIVSELLKALVKLVI